MYHYGLKLIKQVYMAPDIVLMFQKDIEHQAGYEAALPPGGQRLIMQLRFISFPSSTWMIYLLDM